MRPPALLKATTATTTTTANLALLNKRQQQPRRAVQQIISETTSKQLADRQSSVNMCAAVTATASALPMSSAANKANSTNLSATSTAAAGAAAIATAAAANKENVGAGAVAAATAAGAAAAAGGAGAIQKSSVTCRYYLLGICHFGSLCRFSHDDEAAAAATPVVGGEVISKTNSDNSTSSSSSSSAAAAATTSTAATTSAAAASKNKLTNWINAPAFVPSGRKLFNYADIDESDGYDVGGDGGVDGTATATTTSSSVNKTWAEIVGGQDQAAANAIQYSAPPATVDVLCPYKSPCPYGDYCAYTMHLELCKMCDMYVLHPCDIEQRRKHNQACLLQHEKDMELSFAIARSRDKTCGICMDIIMEKQGREKRFGILPNCTHIFCLECIRKWRQAKQFDHKITRSCPECRIASDFVCPSAFWVETKEEKEKLLTDYRAALNVKDCKYFKKGSGKCPFGNKCFYKHALANGELVDVGLPRRSRKLLHQTSELIDLLDIYLWEFVDHRNYNFLDLLSNTSDLSDDSDFES